MVEYALMIKLFKPIQGFSKLCIKNYNSIFLWTVFVVVIGIQFFPQANKFDLVERFLPVMGVIAILTIGCIKGWFFSWWKRRGTVDAKFKGPDFLLSVLLFGFVALSGLSFMFGEVRAFGFTEIYMLMIGALMFLYFSSCNDGHQSLLKKHLPLGLTILLLVNAVGGVYGYLNTDHMRFFGLFYNPEIKADAWPNAYALFFLMTFPFMLYQFFHNNFEKYKDDLEGTYIGMTILKLLATGFVYGSFLIVFSRAGYLAFIVELALLALFFGMSAWPISGKKMLRTIGAVAIIVAIGYGVVYGLDQAKRRSWEMIDVRERLTFSDAQGAASFTERFEFFTGSVELINERPIFGFGPASFKSVYPHVQKGFLALSDHPHNLFLKLAVERGLPAAALFIVFLLILFVKTNPFSKDSSLFCKIAWTAAFGGLTHSMVDHNLNFINNYLIFWLILTALAAEISQKNKSKKTKFTKGDLLTLIFAILLIIPLICSSIHITKDSFDYKKLLSVNANDEKALIDIADYEPVLPRFTYLRLDDAFAQIGQNDIRKILLQKQLSYNSYDAETYRRLGEISLAENNLKTAKEYFKKATEVNPKNTFRYYAAYTKVAAQLNDTSTLNAIRDNVQPLIEEYIPLYNANLHYTQRDNEMEYISELRRILK
ncbi:MAG: O-antigen ligase family protein [Candidatus Peregrinibacteria bacterium]|nr:O-antigen ligase family protein [Candidatus Peregrinibacteria bacterium]MDZ4244841.1 O-antigen ligase family protein [Candidatus Gracilibacteria bacterium]